MISSRIALVVGASLALFFCRGTVRAQQGAGKQPVPWGPRQQKEARDRLAQQRVRIAAATVPPQAQPAGAGETLQSINDEYNRQLLQLEQQRLDRLTRLAASQSPKEAAETYEVLFRLAIANNLFTQAEPAADRVRTAANSPSPVVRFLAETINLIATADRGAYDESLVDLRRLVGAAHRAPGRRPAALLDTPSLLAICGAYYQRLIQGERFDVARKAFQLLGQESPNPDVKEYIAHRLRQLDLIGKAAPPIQGVDVDGKPFDLAACKGESSSWSSGRAGACPTPPRSPGSTRSTTTHRDRGFRIVGINLDALQNGGMKVETVMPNIRRFLLEHNVRWPNLINGAVRRTTPWPTASARSRPIP